LVVVVVVVVVVVCVGVGVGGLCCDYCDEWLSIVDCKLFDLKP
jgi:hypothetical protein